MSNGRRIALPLEDIQGLAFASPAQLREFELLGRGWGLDWPALGVSFDIHELIGGSYGNQLWMEALRRKGAARTERKQAASRTHGAKGGRSRKPKPSAA